MIFLKKERKKDRKNEWEKETQLEYKRETSYNNKEVETSLNK